MAVVNVAPRVLELRRESSFIGSNRECIKTWPEMPERAAMVRRSLRERIEKDYS
jgi:hypothetical protein